MNASGSGSRVSVGLFRETGGFLRRVAYERFRESSKGHLTHERIVGDDAQVPQAFTVFVCFTIRD